MVLDCHQLFDFAATDHPTTKHSPQSAGEISHRVKLQSHGVSTSSQERLSMSMQKLRSDISTAALCHNSNPRQDSSSLFQNRRQSTGPSRLLCVPPPSLPPDNRGAMLRGQCPHRHGTCTRDKTHRQQSQFRTNCIGGLFASAELFARGMLLPSSRLSVL